MKIDPRVRVKSIYSSLTSQESVQEVTEERREREERVSGRSRQPKRDSILDPFPDTLPLKLKDKDTLLHSS